MKQTVSNVAVKLVSSLKKVMTMIISIIRCTLLHRMSQVPVATPSQGYVNAACLDHGLKTLAEITQLYLYFFCFDIKKKQMVLLHYCTTVPPPQMMFFFFSFFLSFFFFFFFFFVKKLFTDRQCSVCKKSVL